MKKNKLLFTFITGGALLLAVGQAQGETLKGAIGKTLKTHPEVRGTAYNTLARTEEVRQAKSDYLPTLDFTAGYGVQDVQQPVDETLHPEIYRLSLRQNIFNGFATVNEVDRQEARVRSEAYRLLGASDFVALRTTEVYLDVLRRQELVDLAEEFLNKHLQIADQIKLRSDSGVGSTADSEQVQGRVALARSNVVITKTNLMDSESSYLAVVGHLPEDLQKPQSAKNILPASLEEAEKIAITEHPVLKSAKADVTARREQHEVAAAPYWPILDLEVDQNWEEDFDTVGSDDNLIVMAKLRFNLFNGFEDQARRAETTFLVSEAQEVKHNTQRQVIESIRLSWMAYQAVLDRTGYLEQRVTATRNTTEAYAKQFNIGKRTLLDVLDSEVEAIEAKKDLVDAEYEGLYSQYRIVSGLGQLVKSFEVELPEETKFIEEGDPDEDLASNG